MTENAITDTTPATPALSAETSAPVTPDTPPATSDTPPVDTTSAEISSKTSETKVDGGFSFPKADDAEAVLNFRKQCGYPDDVSGYGLPMETDEQKDVLNFIHKCQLDPVAAKTVVDNLALEIAEQAKLAKAQYDADYAKISAGWGDNKKAMKV